jgi:hypothetical protein
MADLYDTDAFAWSRQQTDLPRRMAMLDEPPTQPRPTDCPWVVDELLAEGAAP